MAHVLSRSESADCPEDCLNAATSAAMTKALAEPDEYNVDFERHSNDFYADRSSWIALDRTLAHNTSELSRAACSVRRSAGNMPAILISDIQSLPDEIICDSGTEWLNWREFTRCSHSKRT